MTLTTIKVESAVRDALEEQASRRGRSLGEHLSLLAEAEARTQRFEQLREDIAAHPVDARYEAEVEDWESDGWS